MISIKNKMILILIALFCLSLLLVIVVVSKKQVVPSLFCENMESKKELFSFVENPFKPDESIITNPDDFLKAAKDSLSYFTSDKGKAECDYIIRNNYSKVAENSQFKVDDLFTTNVEETLNFIIRSIEKDKKDGKPFRILDPKFLNEHFLIVKWKPDLLSAKERNVEISQKNSIRTTKYAIFKTKGNVKKTKEFPFALYTFTNDKEANDIRFRFTKQDIVDGIFERKEYRNKVRPLIWLSRDGLEEALMQGTIFVVLPDKKELSYTVDKNNGIAYDQRVKNREEQKRYWYFKQIKKNKNDFSKSYIINHGGIILAGDLYNLGLGKIILLKYYNKNTKKDQISLRILADTGGAFVNNLFQIDQFSGCFNDRETFYKETKNYPSFAQAFILEIKKE